MCDPISLIAMVAGIGATLLAPKPTPPPAPEIPAAPAPTSRAAGATVRVGTGAEELKNTDSTQSTATRTVKQRAAGSALGGLGRSTLAL